MLELEIISKRLLEGGALLISGIVIAKIFEFLLWRFFLRIRFPSTLKGMGWEDALSAFGVRFDVIRFIMFLIRWFFIFLFFMIIFDVWGLERVSEIFESIVKYYPNIFISILIFIVSCYLVDFSKKVFIGRLEKQKISVTPLFNKGLSFFIWVFTILAILYQLKIVPELILAIFIGFVIIFSLSFGISFGLGGKMLAEKFLRDIEEKFKR